MFGRKKNIGIGQPTWAAVKRETNDRITKNVNELIAVFFFSAYQSGLKALTLNRIWNHFTENVKKRNAGELTSKECLDVLKEKVNIEIEPYEDWANDIS